MLPMFLKTVPVAIVAAIARMHGGEPFAQSGAGGTSIGFVLGPR